MDNIGVVFNNKYHDAIFQRVQLALSFFPALSCNQGKICTDKIHTSRFVGRFLDQSWRLNP